jgi:hypothetical protein
MGENWLIVNGGKQCVLPSPQDVDLCSEPFYFIYPITGGPLKARTHEIVEHNLSIVVGGGLVDLSKCFGGEYILLVGESEA